MPTLVSHAAGALPRALVLFVMTSVAAGAQQPAQPVTQTPAPRVVRAGEIPAAAANPTRGVRDRAELEAFLDGVMTANLARQARRRRHRRGRQGRCAVLREGLRLRRRRSADAGQRRALALPHRLDQQAVHVDGGDAARRAGEARPRRRRQPLHRLQDPGDVPTADHAAAHHDAHAGIRGGRPRPDHGRHHADRPVRHVARDAHSRASASARARTRRTRTTRQRSPATSSSACPGSRGTTTSSSTSSRRSA